ncbi:MAG: tetratricopeptide repeat protein [Verrucomicrobiia bacterium]
MKICKLTIYLAVPLFGLFLLSGCGKSESDTNKPTGLLSQKQIKAWEEAASKGTPEDQYKLAKLYRDGDGMPKDPAAAAKWFQKAAEAGHAKAQYQLGLLYHEGMGVTQNFQEAIKWYTKAAEQGNGNAQEKLGFMYWTGEGVQQNYVEAYKWLSLAAAEGEGKAAKGLKKLEGLMNQQQINEAKKLVAAFVPKKTSKKSGQK